LSESNFEETNANQLNVRDNLKNMLVQMQQQQLISSFNSSMIEPISKHHSE